MLNDATAETTLRELQLGEFEMLCVLATICEANKLRYWLTAGTLLGAARHKGFIPWDYDIDVAMPRKDFDRLEALAPRVLPSDFFWQSDKTERRYPFSFAKIRKRASFLREVCNAKIEMPQGLFIDIFPLDACPQSDTAGRLFYKFHEFFSSVLRAKVNPDSRCGYASSFMRVVHRLCRSASLPLLKTLRAGLTRMVRWPCRRSGRLATLSAAHGYPCETYAAEWFAETTTLPFEGRAFPVPKGYRALLAHMYGKDWETPYRETHRAPHFILAPEGETL